MKIKERIKSIGFWTGLIGTVFLMLSAFGVEIGDETASAVINAVCSALTLFGVISAPSLKSDESDAEVKQVDELDEQNITHE